MGLRPHGKQLPSPANPEKEICFKITMPDALEYRAAILGQISFLSLWFAWTHVNDGIIPDANTTAGMLWAQAMGTYSFEECMEFCEQVIDCILSDEDTQNAIVDMLKENDVFNQYIDNRVLKLPPTSITAPLVAGSCDDSVLAGQIIAIVERLNTNNVDFLEIVEVGTNDEEKIAAVLEAIPGLDEAPAGDILDMIQNVLEDFSENYAAAVNEEWKSDVEGELWCLAKSKEGCVLTYQDLNDYFQNRAGSGLTIASLINDVIAFIVGGDFPTDELVASGLYAFQLGIILTGQKFAGMKLPTLGAIVRDADPSSAWEDWDPCGPTSDRTPVINSLWDPVHIAGTVTGPDEDGFYVATTTDRGTDRAFTLMDIDGREFILSEVTYPSGVPSCQVWLLDGTLLHIACTGSDMYSGETIDEFTATWAGGGPYDMKFKMIAP